MPGVQSFVAQRQQGQPIPSRQILGSQQRVLVPTTKLVNPKQIPSFQRPNPNVPADPPVAGPSIHSSRQYSAEASALQDGFDTDAEGLDDTATMTVGGSSPGRHGDGDDRRQISSRYGPDAANDFISEARVSIQHGQEQPLHVQGSRQLIHEDSGEEYDERNYEESAEEERDEETDEEELVRDGILQDLNSPGFSQYLQGETSLTAQAISPPVKASPMARSSPVLRDVVQYSRKPANPFTSKGSSTRDSTADPGLHLQRTNCQPPAGAVKRTPAIPDQTFQGISIEQPWITAQIAAQHPLVSDHHEPSRQPSVTSQRRPTLQARLGVAQDIVATNVQPRAHEERPWSVQNVSVGPGGDDSSVNWDPNFDRRHDRKSTASINGPQTRKRARDIDYSLDQLSSMNFQQLSNEPFDLASDTALASIPPELSSGTLAAKMDYILERLKDDDTKVAHRRAFFSSLSIEQYEECANLMIRRFSDIISSFTDARRQRRRAAKDFEKETAKREECVRGKITIVDKDLGRLKRGGEEVVRGPAL